MIGSSGIILGSILVSFLLVEIAILYFLDFEELSKAPENVEGDKKVKQIGKWYVSTTLTFSGLVFTGITIILSLSTSPEEYASPIFLLGMAIALFLITYKLYFHALSKLFYLYLMDKTIAYGFFSFILGLILIFNTYFTSNLLLIPFAGGFLIIVILHLIEFKKNIESLS